MIIPKKSDELIAEFTSLIRERFPEVSVEQVYNICRSPFKLIASEMKSGRLRSVRIKYLGTFSVFPGRVKGIYKKIQILHSQGKASDERLAQAKKRMDDYFSNYITHRTKYEDYEEDSLD